MSHDTIPAPTEHHIANARAGAREARKRFASELEREEHSIQRIAALQAEVDWLHKLIQRGV